MVPQSRGILVMCVVLLTPTASAQGTNTVTGSAVYRERMALPAKAAFEATLEDVSRADAPATVVAWLHRPGPVQTPFQFSIAYEPSQIASDRSYVVRARVILGDAVLFATDQGYPVLTRGHSNDAGTLLLTRVEGPLPVEDSLLGALPASFIGNLPCADCPGIRYLLNLFPDQSFFLRLTYIDRGAPLDDVGRWKLSSDGSTLILQGGRDAPERFAIKGNGVLSRLNSEGNEIDARYEVRRTGVFDPIEPRLLMRGMFRYMADAATFTECLSGQSWPVAPERDYRTLESAYLKIRREPGEELLVSLEGQAAQRPDVDGGGDTLQLVAERYIGIWPGETCGAPFATEQLQETYWKLTRLENKPVILTERQREPNLIFRAEQGRLTGFAGCNSLTGSYQLNGSDLTLGSIATTMMACVEGSDTERDFLSALNQVRRWKIVGQHLELSGGDGKILARFEARALQ